MEPDRYTEVLLKYRRSQQVDREAADIVEQLCRLSQLAESGRLTGAKRAPLTVVDESHAAVRDNAPRLASRRLEPASAPVLSDERWDSLLKCTSDLVVVVDVNGSVLYVNQVPTGLGGRREDIIGANLCDLLAPRSRASFRTAIERVIESGQKQCQVISFLGGDGASSRWEASMGPISHDARVRWVGVFLSDITEHRETEARLRESEVLLRSVVKSIPKMICILEGVIRQSQADPRHGSGELGVLHGLMMQMGRLLAVEKAGADVTVRLPQFLTAINMFVENALFKLQRISYSEGARQDLEAALKAVSVVARSVRLVQRFGRAAAGRTWVHRVDIRRAASDVIHLLEARMRLANLSIRIEDTGRWPQVYMAEDDADQLLFALIESLIPSVDGQRRHLITVSGIVRDRDFEMRFSGDATCIPTERLDRVFDGRGADPSIQIDDVGLHVAQGIVARAGGKIVIDGQARGYPALVIVLPMVDGTDVIPE